MKKLLYLPLLFLCLACSKDDASTTTKTTTATDKILGKWYFQKSSKLDHNDEVEFIDLNDCEKNSFLDFKYYNYVENAFFESFSGNCKQVSNYPYFLWENIEGNEYQLTTQSTLGDEKIQNVQVNFKENQMIITYENQEKTYFIKAE